MHPTSVVHSLVRFRDGALARAPRLPRHARADLVRAHLSRARAPSRAAPLDLAAGLDARVRGARRRDVPAASRSRGTRASAAAPSRAPTTPRTRWRWRRSSTGASGSSRSPTPSRTRSTRVDGAPARDLDELVEADAEARRARRAEARSGMTIFIAIVGLGLLVFVHELGHFFASLALADAPAQVLHRLPAGGREAHAQRDRVRHRDDPARRLREDPRDAPARAGATSTRPSGGRSRRQPGLAPAADRLRQSLDAGDHDAARDALAAFAELGRAAAALGARRPRCREGRRPTSGTRSARTPTGGPARGSACS